MHEELNRRGRWRRMGLSVLAGMTLLGTGAVMAHHSGAMFERDVVLELSGTVKEFQWTNPHTWIQVYVENEAGEVVEWSIEAGGPNSLARSGWRPNTFSPGAEVTIRTRPMRNGAPAGAFVGARFADGSTIGRWEDSSE